MIDHAASGQVVLFCRDLAAAEAFFTPLGFRLVSVFPADAPRQIVLTGNGLALYLQRSSVDGGGHLRLVGEAPRTLTAPNGTRVDIVPRHDAPPRVGVDAAFAVHRPRDRTAFHQGRAGMLYRDLLPGRLLGAVIASHIRIPRGGPVPDYVHSHRVHGQAIYVLAGEVTVVYEDQGPPFVLRAGDCVLQPPGIRHRVIACSDGLEVIEVASPAEHLTVVEHELALPTATLAPDRRFGGQRFWRHVAAAATTQSSGDGFRMRDCGIGQASNGNLALRVCTRAADGPAPTRVAASSKVRLGVMVAGTLTLAGQTAVAGDLFVLPPTLVFPVAGASADLEWLEFALPHELGAVASG